MIHLPYKRVWIVGARGFLGSELASCLARQGVACEMQGGRFVPGIVRQCSADEQETAAQHMALFDPRMGDHGIAACVQEPGVIRRVLDAMGEPEVVYFCAATRGGDAEAYRRAYLEPVRAVAAAVPGARLVFCSSAAVYEGRGDVSENSPTPGSTEKARILLEAEQAVLSAGGVVARLVSLYGMGRCELLRRHLAGEPQLPGSPERVLNYLHVVSAARVLHLLGYLPQIRHRVYNVCEESFTKAQAYAMLESLTGIPASREVSPAGRRGVSDHRVLAERLESELCVPRLRFSDYVRGALAAHRSA